MERRGARPLFGEKPKVLQHLTPVQRRIESGGAPPPSKMQANLRRSVDVNSAPRANPNRCVLLNEPNRHRVLIEFPFAGLDRGNDDEDSVQDPEDRKENEPD